MQMRFVTRLPQLATHTPKVAATLRQTHVLERVCRKLAAMFAIEPLGGGGGGTGNHITALD